MSGTRILNCKNMYMRRVQIVGAKPSVTANSLAHVSRDVYCKVDKQPCDRNCKVHKCRSLLMPGKEQRNELTEAMSRLKSVIRLIDKEMQKIRKEIDNEWQ